VLLGLLIAVAGLMATACFGLAVLLIRTVGWLWPAKSEDDGSVLRGGEKLSWNFPGYSLPKIDVDKGIGDKRRYKVTPQGCNIEHRGLRETKANYSKRTVSYR
jgi:hypothetical protein